MVLSHPPVLLSGGNAVGRKEGEGPIGSSFDLISQDDRFGQKSWEKAESEMQRLALSSALEKAGLDRSAVELLLAGDLLNQCIASGFSARDTGLPFLGLYGACSTMGEGLLLASLLLDGGFCSLAAAVTSSHFCTAERQYRTPLHYGGQRSPTAQWTATAAGAVLLAREGQGPRVTACTVGKVVDKGISDPANMGAAMAPVDVKLAPHPEETRQYKIQLFSTKYVLFPGGDVIFRINSNFRYVEPEFVKRPFKCKSCA